MGERKADDPESLIRDADLVAQLAGAKASPVGGFWIESLVRIQAERDAERALSPVKRRRVETRKVLASQQAEDDDRHHIHSVLALCGLPYRDPGEETRDFIREYGRNSLSVQAGYLKDPMTGRMRRQGLPYGPKARLLLLHICTTAIRQKSATIEIADSMSAFVRDLGFSVTGGKRGTLTQFKEQLNRLAAARMQLGLWHGERATTINAQPIKAFDIWLPSDPDQKLLWSSTLQLDTEFFESLRKHALPVDIRALRAFSQSARQIDMLLWLGYRLRTVNRRYVISWTTLAEQFGGQVARSRKFKEMFADDLAAMREVFPALPATITDEGLVLTPCAPAEAFAARRRLT